MRELFTLLWHFLKNDENKSKTHFKQCSHIELNTQIPNPIFKITIHYTKYTKHAKILSICWIVWEHFETKKCFFVVIYVNSIIHILYFSIFCNFCNFVVFVFLYLYILIDYSGARLGAMGEGEWACVYWWCEVSLGMRWLMWWGWVEMRFVVGFVFVSQCLLFAHPLCAACDKPSCAKFPDA